MSELSNIKITSPQYDDVIPSTGNTVKLTPFRVGDEKALLIAQQSGNNKQMANTLKSIISKNVVPVNIADLAPFDLEYLFLKLRAVSVGETSKIGVKCKNCEASNEIDVDLNDVEVKKDENHKNFVKIDEKLGFEMKYADLDDMMKVDGENIESIIGLIAASVKTVYFNEDTYNIGKAEQKDLMSILNDLTTTQFSTIQQYFETMPKVRKDINFTCKSCETENNQVLEGLASFF